MTVRTRDQIVAAARTGLLQDGYARLSTRRVAELAGVPLSQLHYHFGGKQRLILSVLEWENERLLERQARMYGQDRPLWERYDQACDFLDEDLASGYVRVLQEMIAVGWSDSDIANAVRRLVTGWFSLLTAVAVEAERKHGPIGRFSAQEMGTLICLMFVGGESMLLLGVESSQVPVRAALRRFGDTIRQFELGGTT